VSSKQLTGPRSNWLKWREARDRRLEKPRRNAGARAMEARAKARSSPGESTP